MGNNKKIMILGAGEFQVPVIHKAKEEGYYTIVVDYDSNAPGLEFANKKLIISTHDKEKVLEAALEYKIDGILTTSDYPVRVVAYVAEKMGLPALSQKAANICTNKFLLRETLKNSKLNSPKYLLIQNENDLSKVDFFPAIIKPVDSSASRGVKRINNRNELINGYKEAISFSNSGNVIVEEFIEGKEFSIESITYQGNTEVIAITEKKKIGEHNKYFVEFAHFVPADLNDEQTKLIKTTVTKLINLIGLNNSSSHTEIILSKNKVYIVEIGARLGGDFITSDLVPLATGIDMLKNVIKLSVGEAPNIIPTKKQYAAIQFLTPQNYHSALKFINKKEKGVVKYNFSPFANKKIKNSLDRLGYVIIQATNRKDLENLIKKINNENK